MSLLACPQYGACNYGFFPPVDKRVVSLQSERGLTVCVHLRNKLPRVSVGIGYRKEPLLGSQLYSYGTSILTVCGDQYDFMLHDVFLCVELEMWT